MRNGKLYIVMREFTRLALGFYFRRIDHFHADRVPLNGPVLFVSNHPGSLTDSFLIGLGVPRRVNFIATAQMFRFAPLRCLLARCGVIPINRAKDDPRAMRTVADTFEACYRVFERGETVGIFPEGVTYDDSRLREIKSGAARMALEIEHRHQGALGLQVVPIGLTFSAKQLYRSTALVNFGEPLRAADFIEGYADNRKDCILRLTAEIERRIQAQIVHIPALEQTRVIEAVRRLYLDRLRVGHSESGEPISPRAEELVLTQKIVAAVEHVYRTQPERAASFAARLDAYERWLRRLQIHDEVVAEQERPERFVAGSLLLATLAVVGAPLALYGWIHRAIPAAIVVFAVARFTAPDRRKAQTAITSIVAGTVAFSVCYGAFVAIFHAVFGWPWSLWYALSLVPASLVAFYYVRQLRHLLRAVRYVSILVRAPVAARRLMARRADLVAEIETVHREIGENLK